MTASNAPDPMTAMNNVDKNSSWNIRLLLCDKAVIFFSSDGGAGGLDERQARLLNLQALDLGIDTEKQDAKPHYQLQRRTSPIDVNLAALLRNLDPHPSPERDLARDVARCTLGLRIVPGCVRVYFVSDDN